jgi:hypothetical protein
MQALRYEAEVGADGEVSLPRLRLDRGTHVEVIVLVRETGSEYDGLLESSESTTAFWDNPIDDEVWNNA